MTTVAISVTEEWTKVAEGDAIFHRARASLSDVTRAPDQDFGGYILFAVTDAADGPGYDVEVPPEDPESEEDPTNVRANDDNYIDWDPAADAPIRIRGSVAVWARTNSGTTVIKAQLLTPAE